MREWLSGYVRLFFTFQYLTSTFKQNWKSCIKCSNICGNFWEVCSQKEKETNCDTSRIYFNIGCLHQKLWLQHLQCNSRNKNMLKLIQLFSAFVPGKSFHCPKFLLSQQLCIEYALPGELALIQISTHGLIFIFCMQFVTIKFWSCLYHRYQFVIVKLPWSIEN